MGFIELLLNGGLYWFIVHHSGFVIGLRFFCFMAFLLIVLLVYLPTSFSFLYQSS